MKLNSHLIFRRVHNNQEDDDLDAMINDLKQKTSGRDMHKMVQDIEGERPIIITGW